MPPMRLLEGALPAHFEISLLLCKAISVPADRGQQAIVPFVFAVFTYFDSQHAILDRERETVNRGSESAVAEVVIIRRMSDPVPARSHAETSRQAKSSVNVCLRREIQDNIVLRYRSYGSAQSKHGQHERCQRGRFSAEATVGAVVGRRFGAVRP
jgi:hypothetical protein